MRRISDDGLKMIQQWEGCYLTAYHGAADRPGLLTIGYGHTDAAGPPTVTAGMTITKKQASDILRTDLGGCEASVERMVKVFLNDNQFAALVSFVFNVGEANFGKSNLLRKLNSGDYASVPAELMKWTKANGVTVKGLANRRAAEAGLWAKGAPIASQYVEPEPEASLGTTPATTALRVGGGATAVVTAASQLASAINGPVADKVEQVKQTIDTGGEIIGTTRQIFDKAPEGTWQHVMSFVQSPKFLLAALILVGGAWLVTYLIRRKNERDAAP